MTEHVTKAVVVHCIDFQFQEYLDPWLQKNIIQGNYDRVSIAGGVFDVFSVLKQVDISKRLHDIKKVILINHEDCGAYGDDGSDERHKGDLRKAREKINKLFPHMDVDLFYLCLDGTFEHID